MITQPRSRLAVVQPNGPDDRLIPGLTASTRLTSEQTGSISIVEHVFSPGTLVPPHTHTLEDEISYVVSGDIGFRSNGKELTLRAGGYIVKPRGELHSMWNAGSVNARMIEIISPAGFENYFVELAEAVAAAGGLPDPASMAKLRAVTVCRSTSVRSRTSSRVMASSRPAGDRADLCQADRALGQADRALGQADRALKLDRHGSYRWRALEPFRVRDLVPDDSGRRRK